MFQVIRKIIYKRSAMRSTAKFVERYNKIKSTYYKYSKTEILHYEENSLKDSVKVKEISGVINDTDSLDLIFDDPKRNIWIPKRMVMVQDLTEFMETLNIN